MSNSKDSSDEGKYSKGIMSEMQTVENILKSSLHRVDGIEKKLQAKLLTLENRERLERELDEVKEVLRRNQERLQGLRGQNTKSFMVAASVVFACFLIYGLYCAIYNMT